MTDWPALIRRGSPQPPHVSREAPPRYGGWGLSLSGWVLLAWGDAAGEVLLALWDVPPWRRPVVLPWPFHPEEIRLGYMIGGGPMKSATQTNGRHQAEKVQAPSAPSEVQQIPLGRIRPSPTNPRKRFDQEELARMAETMKAHGVLQAVVVRPRPRTPTCLAVEWWQKEGEPDLELVAGERRLRAAKLAGLETIPGKVCDLDDVTVLEIQAIENECREDTTALEKADHYQRMVEAGAPAEQIAAKVGVSVSTVRDLLRVGKLAQEFPKVRKALEEGGLSPSVAALLARVPGPEARRQAAEWALQGNYGGELPSYRQVKQDIQHRFTVELKQAPFPTGDKKLLPEAGSCKECPRRVGNLQKVDPTGYEGCRQDVCTDPECFRRKVAAHQARAEEKAQAQGKAVLPAEEAQKIFSRYSDHSGQHGRSKWLGLDGTWHAPDGGFTVRERLKGRLDGHQVLAHDQDGRPHWLVPRKLAVQLIEADVKAREGKAAEKEAAHVPRVPSDWAVGKRARALALEEIGTTALANFEDLDGLASQGGPETNAAYNALQLVAWQAALNELEDRYGDDDDLCPLSRRIPGLFELDDQAEEQRRVAAWAAAASPRELLAYLLETSASGAIATHDDAFKPIGEAVLLNFTDAGKLSAFEKLARKELTSEARAKSRGKPAGKEKKEDAVAQGEPKATPTGLGLLHLSDGLRDKLVRAAGKEEIRTAPELWDYVTEHDGGPLAAIAALGIEPLVAAEEVLTALEECLGVKAEGEPACRVCGCTEEDCQRCTDRTGEPCWWTEEDLCSACGELVETDVKAIYEGNGGTLDPRVVLPSKLYQAGISTVGVALNFAPDADKSSRGLSAEQLRAVAAAARAWVDAQLQPAGGAAPPKGKRPSLKEAAQKAKGAKS